MHRSTFFLGCFAGPMAAAALANIFWGYQITGTNIAAAFGAAVVVTNLRDLFPKKR